MILVDSNHWVYYLDDGAPEHDAVEPRLDDLLDAEELLQPTVVQLEVAHFAARRWGPQAAAPMGLFLGLPARVAGLGPEEVRGAVALLDAHAKDGIGGRDAAVLDAAVRHGVSLLVTADKPLARVARKLGLPARDLARR